MRSSISPLKRDGFTIDGTGYFAGHQESHRILYAKTPWCRWIWTVLSFIVPLACLAIGALFNVPVLALIGFGWLGVMAYIYAPRKGKK
jgi:hypothetical protein